MIDKERSLAYRFPELAKEWHPTKNGDLTPNDVTFGSGKKVWWKCSKGHEWESTIANRTKGKNCPFCTGQKVWIGFNDLGSVNPKLAAEWHPTKNELLSPQKVTANSRKTVLWKCSQGHEWQAAIYSRNSGSACPYCSGRLSIKGITDLLTTHPEIAAEWHPTKNGDLTPNDVTSGSGKKVWWKCVRGHEWKAAVYSRIHNGCPFCSSESKTSFPEQAIFFYLQKITLAYNRYQIKPRTEMDIYLPVFKIGVEYDGEFFHNTNLSKEREKKKNEVLLELGIHLLRVKESSQIGIENSTDQIIYCRPYPTNDELKAVMLQLLSRISFMTQNKFNLDIDVDRDRSSIYAQYIELEKSKSLAVQYPNLSKQWHPTKNGTLSPQMVTVKSAKKVWWKCEKGHEWQAVVHSRVEGNGCPYCSGWKTTSGKNDLATLKPELISQWHPTKNEKLLPQDVSVQSNKKVWWRCECGHEWQAAIYSRSKGHGCPICAKEKQKKGR